MPYITLSYITDRVRERLLIELTDGTTAVDTARVNKAISDADAYINTRLCRVYTTPITEPAEALTVLQRYELDIALYYLYSEPFGRDIPEDIKERYRNAITDLNSYATGVLSLGSTAISAAPVALASNGTTKVFTDTLIATI